METILLANLWENNPHILDLVGELPTLQTTKSTKSKIMSLTAVQGWDLGNLAQHDSSTMFRVQTQWRALRTLISTIFPDRNKPFPIMKHSTIHIPFIITKKPCRMQEKVQNSIPPGTS